MEKEIIYNKTSEEYKAIKILESKTTNYSDDSLVLHYNITLYNLIINLMKENKKQKEIIGKAIEYVKENVNEIDDGNGYYWWEIISKDDLLQILEDKEV